MIKIIMVIALLGIMGCSSHAYFIRDNEGRVVEIKTKGNIEAMAKTEKEEVSCSSKQDMRLIDLSLSGLKR